MDKHSEDKRQSHKFNGATAGQLMESVLTLVPYDIRGAARVDLQTAIQLAILDDQEALPLDLEHEPADLAEAVEMLRRAKRALESAKAPSSLANNELEQRIVEMIRYIGVKAGIAETVYGAMCHEARCILSDYTSAATAMPDSPTPRTDDAKFKAGDTDADLEVVTAEFAGQLERGLADMTQARDAIRLLAQGWKEDAERAALSSAIACPDLELLSKALGNTAACLGDALAIYNQVAGKQVFKNAGPALADENPNTSSEHARERIDAGPAAASSPASTTQEPWSAPCGCTDRFMCVGHVLEIRAKNTTRDTPPASEREGAHLGPRGEKVMPQFLPPKRDWIEEELKDGDRICEAAGVERTEGGRLPVAKIINKLRSSTPPTTTCNEPVAWAMYAIDTEELVCVNAIPPDDREGLRIEPLYLASSAMAMPEIRQHDPERDVQAEAVLAEVALRDWQASIAALPVLQPTGDEGFRAGWKAGRTRARPVDIRQQGDSHG